MTISINTLIESLADQISSSYSDFSNVILVGIVTRGYPLAKRIQKLIQSNTNQKISLGKIDITLYRDDLDSKASILNLKETDLPTPVEEKDIILVDDVLFHGRTVRAAMNHILDYGRPKKIKLAILVDRGHRELPICPDYLGTKIETDEKDIIKIKLQEIDKKDTIEKNEKTI